MFSGGDLSPSELLRHADQAMHAAKDAGGGCCRMFAA
jgi:GGDEF domain-containing protein